MTQSGQGEEPRLPAARPVREGIVLPADGSEPLLPGTAGDQTAPAGGRPWGQPWGPEEAPPAPPASATSGYEWGAAAGQASPGAGAPGYPQAGVPGWGAAPGHATSPAAPAPWGIDDAGQPTQQPPTAAAPYPGTHHADPQLPDAQHPGARTPGTHVHGALTPGNQVHRAQTSGAQHPGAQITGTDVPGAEHSEAQIPGARQPGEGPAPLPRANAFPTADQGAAGAGGGQGAPQLPAAGYGGALPPTPPTGFGATPPPTPPTGFGGALPAAPGQGTGPQPPHGQAAPLPPAGHAAATLPPTAHGTPLPPAADPAEATQYMPPVAGAGAQAGAGSFDEGATQYIPPVAPGALPPEAAADATQYLGRAPRDGAPAGPGPDSEPTQYIAPVPAPPPGAPYGIRPGAPDDRQAPPAEFDSLFRADPEPQGPAATQQLPRFQPPTAPAGHYGAAVPETGGRAAARQAAGGGTSGRTRSKLPLIAAAGIGIAVLGIGAGAFLGAGNDTKDDNKTVSTTAPADDESASPTVDPAKEQAVALDKLLADSNNSRDAVIKAVANVRACNNLGQAATDLRNAAKQRNGLITRLAALSVDKLPNHTRLTTALNNAWKASASADNHYAAWADEVAGKKGCRKGEARSTAHHRAGDRASGTATTEKSKAAALWNTIATTYDLTQRRPYQL
ncbi:hypothetical protein H1V43_26990 [Streptomyces sp. PSKA54]|uniref:Uncharacterized protein n=1 Tax=Streptomyces himalayensis subsp. aureolus TaxID=2758039 RepID=A0A7W2HIE1_9ACTN|nr:hypothetical protein [Streptomyces himalayensis]MBA4864931.1 hypothetical protein [Streptomyces himalayensis subsp. aureolus]